MTGDCGKGEAYLVIWMIECHFGILEFIPSVSFLWSQVSLFKPNFPQELISSTLISWETGSRPGPLLLGSTDALVLDAALDKLAYFKSCGLNSWLYRQNWLLVLKFQSRSWVGNLWNEANIYFYEKLVKVLQKTS